MTVTHDRYLTYYIRLIYFKVSVYIYGYFCVACTVVYDGRCWFSAANRSSPTCVPPDEQMFNVARHQFHSHQQQQQQLLAPLTGAVDDRSSAPASPCPSSPSPPHAGASRAGDSPTTAAAAADDAGSWPVSAQPAAPRRRAVDASDLRQCALVQTRLKAWKSGYVSSTE